MERNIHVTCTVCRKKITTGMTNLNNSEKAEICGYSKAVLSYILLSSNHLMARVFAFLHCYRDHKIIKH